MTRTQVKVIFAAAPQHNYTTSVSDGMSDVGIESYFVGTSFDMGDGNGVNYAVCTSVEISRQPEEVTYPIARPQTLGRALRPSEAGHWTTCTGIDSVTVALYNDLMAITATREELPNGMPSHSARYIAGRLLEKGWRK